MCSAYAYLFDSNTPRITYTNQTPAYILGDLLNKHNAKMADANKKIYLGNVELNQAITIDFNYDKTITATAKVRNILGGDIRIRESNGTLYLDYLLAQGSNNEIEVRLGYNLQTMKVEYDPKDIVTRLYGLGYGDGINQLTITKVNNGLEYLDADVDTISKYGIIEDVYTDKNIQDAATMKYKLQNILDTRKQPKLSITCDSKDLSVLPGHSNESFGLGDSLHLVNDKLNFNGYVRVIEIDVDLIKPWNPKLTISTRPISLTDITLDLKQRNLTLETAPQGSTFINTFGFPDNIDADSPMLIPVWIPSEVLNINRVRLHIDTQKFRAYSKNITGGASTRSTTEYKSWAVQTDLGYCEAGDFLTEHVHWILGEQLSHSHGMSHTHPSTINYGIYESTCPQNVTIAIDNVNVAGPYATDGNAVSFDIDLTQYINTPGRTYIIGIGNSRLGRINAWISIQCFIQIK
jgi:hypothetical protein